MDFGLVPPEIQSTLMYAGPGPGPILATAAAWDGLAAELEAAATAYASQIDDLTSTPWLGGASEAMTASVAPYVAWIDMTAAQAAETAAQVRAGVAAYETAFAATVPPTVVAHNRAELTALIATNIFGQNSAAIATNQAVYGEMWAQDAAAMYGYASDASGATRLTAVAPPPTVADGLAETAAVVQAVEGGQDALAQGAQAVPAVLEQLSLPAQAGVADVVVDDVVGEVVTGNAISGLGMGSAYHGALSSVNLFQRLSTDFVRQFSTSNAPTTTDIMERVNRIGLATGAILPDELDEAGGAHLGLGGFGDWHNWEQWLRQFGSRIGHAFLSAQSGQAGSVGALSVPRSWLAVPPDVQLAALEEASAHAAPEAADGASAGPAALVAGGVGSSMIGRALGAAAGARESADGRNRIVASAEPQRPETTVAELRERAELLREFSELRDSGALSEAEFAEQKRLVMRAADQPRVR